MLYLQAADKAYDIAMAWVHQTIGHDHTAEAIVATLLLEAFVAIPAIALVIGIPAIMGAASGQPVTHDPVTDAAVAADGLLALDATVQLALTLLRVE